MSYAAWLLKMNSEAPDYKQRIILVLARVLGAIKRHYDSPYCMKTRLKLNELTGGGRPVLYLKEHIALKLTASFAGVALSLLIAAFSSFDMSIAVFSAVVSVLAAYLPDTLLDREVKQRRMQLRLDFPFFLMKLSLLLNTGMGLTRAWTRIAADNSIESHLYREVSKTVMEITSGKPESKAYEDFAKRCRVDEVSRFVSILEQYRRKGSFEFVSLLKHLAGECWERRKNMISKLAEESSTRLLFPLMLIFIGIMIIVIAPAVISLRNIK